MHQHQDVDVGRDRVDIEAKRFELIELAQLFDDRHRPARPATHRRRHVAFERQAADQPNRGALRHGEAVDEAGQVVFE